MTTNQCLMPHSLMLDETRAKIFVGMSREWRTFDEIAEATGLTLNYVKVSVYRLHRWAEVEKLRTLLPGRVTKWRIAPVGYIEPLFELDPRCDAWPLAECWGGYTYKRAT